MKTNTQAKKTYILRKKGSGEILIEPNHYGNGQVVNIITDLNEIETKLKMYYSKDYYIDELLLTEE